MTNQEHDKFDAPAFEGSRSLFPYMQVLNSADEAASGFFVTRDNAKLAGFTPNAEWTEFTATFQPNKNKPGGKATVTKIPGWRSTTARFLVLKKSPLEMFDRKSGGYLGVFKKGAYDRSTMLLKMRYLVFLVGRHKELLNKEPFIFTTKGSFCGSFGDAYRQFQDEMSQAFTATIGNPRPRGDRFLALSVFGVNVQPELKGSDQKAWVSSIASFGHPTAQNWKGFFVGYGPLEDRILKVFDELSPIDLGVHTSTTESQPDEWD